MTEETQALLVIDVQNEYFTGRLPATFPEECLSNIKKAMDHASGAEVAVAVIVHTAAFADSPTFRRGSIEWKLHAEIEKRRRDILIEKSLPGSFTGTALESWLRERQVKRVVICGYMAQMCCDTTARQAFHLGFHVDLLSDATGTLAVQNSAGSISAQELHRAVMVTQAMRFARVMKTDEWISGRINI
ncbi:putative isochorismatase family protein [uncultured archaeon]|nr:putative isochorismatase family protein [uncultured archaeon]